MCDGLAGGAARLVKVELGSSVILLGGSNGKLAWVGFGGRGPDVGGDSLVGVWCLVCREGGWGLGWYGWIVVGRCS